MHALRDCPWVRAVWFQLGVKELNQVFWGSNLQDWLGIVRVPFSQDTQAQGSRA